MSRMFTLMERVFEAALVEEKERLDTNLNWIRTSIRLLSEEGGGVEGGEPHQLATRHERREREQMADVKAALKRLDEGGYGRCELCAEPIELSSLLEVPWTRFCADCLATATPGISPSGDGSAFAPL